MSIVQRLRKILQKDHEEFITELYRELLNREPDMEGFVHIHVNLLSSSVVLRQTANGELHHTNN